MGALMILVSASNQTGIPAQTAHLRRHVQARPAFRRHDQQCPARSGSHQFCGSFSPVMACLPFRCALVPDLHRRHVPVPPGFGIAGIISGIVMVTLASDHEKVTQSCWLNEANAGATKQPISFRAACAMRKWSPPWAWRQTSSAAGCAVRSAEQADRSKPESSGMLSGLSKSPDDLPVHLARARRLSGAESGNYPRHDDRWLAAARSRAGAHRHAGRVLERDDRSQIPVCPIAEKAVEQIPSQCAETMRCPPRKGALSAEQVTVMPPGSKTPWCAA